MCRNKDERNERCDCDTSEARRLRRHTRDALDRYADAAYQPIAPNFLPSVLMEPFTVESVRHDISSITSSIKELIDQGHNDETIFIFLDKRINKIGSGVEYLSENSYGAPTDQAMCDLHDSFHAPFLEHKAAALEAGMTEDEAAEQASDKIDADYQRAMTQLIAKRNDAFKNSLTDVGVQFADPETFRYSPKSDKKAVQLLQKSLSFYPQSWVNASNNLNDSLRVKYIKEDIRASYESKPVFIFKRASTLSINEFQDDYAGGLSTGMHEFAHRIEDSVPGITEMEKTFVLRRTGHYAEENSSIIPEKVSPIIEEGVTESNKRNEMGFKDNFPTHYMGRVYNSGTWEVLAMGMESLFTGTNGGLAGIQTYKADSDYKKFILGVLASSASAFSGAK